MLCGWSLLLLFYSSHKSSEVTTKEAPIFSKAEFADIGFEISLGYLILKAHVSISFFLTQEAEWRSGWKRGIYSVKTGLPKDIGREWSFWFSCGWDLWPCCSWFPAKLQSIPHLPWNGRFSGKRFAHFLFANQGKMQTRWATSLPWEDIRQRL